MFVDAKDKLFCEIAVDLGFLNQDQVNKALEQQKVDRSIGVTKPIGAYLFEANAVTKEQISQILKIQDKYDKAAPPQIDQQQQPISPSNSIPVSIAEKSDTGANLIVISGIVAFISLFLNWVDVGIASRNGLDQGGFIGLLFLLYPFYKAVKKQPLMKVVSTLLAFLSLGFVFLYIQSKTTKLFNKEVNLAASGAYLYLISNIGVLIGLFLYNINEEVQIAVTNAGIPVQAPKRSWGSYVVLVLVLFIAYAYIDERAKQKRRLCRSSMRLLLGAVELYNIDHMKNPLRSISASDYSNGGILISSGGLKSPIEPLPGCSYSASGDLSGDGYIQCSRHGSLNDDSTDTKTTPAPTPTQPSISQQQQTAQPLVAQKPPPSAQEEPRSPVVPALISQDASKAPENGTTPQGQGTNAVTTSPDLTQSKAPSMSVASYTGAKDFSFSSDFDSDSALKEKFALFLIKFFSDEAFQAQHYSFPLTVDRDLPVGTGRNIFDEQKLKSLGKFSFNQILEKFNISISPNSPREIRADLSSRLYGYAYSFVFSKENETFKLTTYIDRTFTEANANPKNASTDQAEIKTSVLNFYTEVFKGNFQPQLEDLKSFLSSDLFSLLFENAGEDEANTKPFQFMPNDEKHTLFWLSSPVVNGRVASVAVRFDEMDEPTAFVQLEKIQHVQSSMEMDEWFITNICFLNSPDLRSRLSSGEVGEVIAPSGAIVRDSPSKSGKKITTLPKTSKIAILSKDGPQDKVEKTVANWFKVRLSDKSTGWVFGGLIGNIKNEVVQVPNAVQHTSSTNAGVKRTPNEALKALMSSLSQAFGQEDLQTMSSLTHPDILRLKGGHENFCRATKADTEKLKEQGFMVNKVSLESPTPFISQANFMLSILSLSIPFEIKGKSGVFKMPGIAFSDDTGSTFYFVDNKDLLKSIIPADLFSKIDLPPFKMVCDGKVMIQKDGKWLPENGDGTSLAEEKVPGVSYEQVGPQIKGMFLGMNLFDALKIVKTKFQGNWSVQPSGNGFSIGSPVKLGTLGYAQPIFIFGNAKKQVVKISFNVTNALFNSADMSPEDFSKEILNAYNIPELKPFFLRETIEWNMEKTFSNGWEYSSPEGWKISILNPEKTVILEAIAKATERKFD